MAGGRDDSEADFAGDGRRRAGARGVLVFDRTRHGAGERALGPHARSRQRQGDVLRRRLRVLPCGAEAAGPNQARRRAGVEFSVWHFLRPQYFIRPEGRHRRLERSAIRHRHDQGNLAVGRASLSSFSLYVVSTHAVRRPARSVRFSQDAAAGIRARARPRSAVSVQHPAHARRSGSCCFSTASRSSPIRRDRRNGTGALTWSTAPATARNVTRRATHSAA